LINRDSAYIVYVNWSKFVFLSLVSCYGRLLLFYLITKKSKLDLKFNNSVSFMVVRDKFDFMFYDYQYLLIEYPGEIQMKNVLP
jgi:hypothetical protein